MEEYPNIPTIPSGRSDCSVCAANLMPASDVSGSSASRSKQWANDADWSTQIC
jgi:hypothetical protein